MTDRWLDKDQKFYNYRTAEVNGNDIFDTKVASNSWAQNFIDDPKYMREAKNMEMKIIQMSPKKYWEICAKDVFNKPVNQLMHQWRTLDAKTLDHLKQVIQIYHKRFPITYIDYARHDGAKQEGLHRMIVAGDLFGWDTKFPVMVIDWADKDKAEFEKINIRNNKINNYIGRAIDKSLNYNYNNIDEFKDQLYSEIMHELKYDEEFEDGVFKLDLNRNHKNNGFEVIVNDRYTGEVCDEDINISPDVDSELVDDTISYEDLDDVDLDTWLVSYLNENIPINYSSIDQYLTSNQLDTELRNIFGDNYSEKNISRDICKYIQDKCPSCEVISTGLTVLMEKDNEFIELCNRGYAVIRVNNRIYDFTSEQFNIPELSKAKSQPRTLNYNELTSHQLDVNYYNDGNYIIIF